MSTIIRYGAGSHFMRPDGVMRSSIVQPMFDYQPDSDVQSVAMAFTQGPPRAMSLSGPSLGGVFSRWIDRIKARFHMRRANQFMFQGMQGNSSPGPIMPQANQIAPQMQSQMIALQQLMQFQNTQAIRGVVAVASDQLAHRRPFSYWYAG